MQLEPFAYHLAIADRLERAAPDLWRSLQQEHIGERYRELTTADLQQRATRMERGTAIEHRYALAETARARLSVGAPLILFRLREPTVARQPFLVFMPGEICIVLSADDHENYTADEEWLAAIGREIARFRFYTEGDGRLHIATRMLHWQARQEGCASEIVETLRRFKLLTDAYCDIGGFMACESRAAIDINAVVSPVIELGSLDLLDQEAVHDLTRAVLARVLAEPAVGTLAAVAQAREMFPDAPPIPNPKPLQRASASLSASVIDYLAFLLLDFTTAEGTRLRDSIAVAATAADELGIGPRFREITRQELRGRRGLQAGLAVRRAA
jgi:hypothetical protein